MIPVLVTTLIPLIPSIIKSVEALFGRGSGKEKAAAALEMVKPLAAQLAKTGALPKEFPPEVLEALVEVVVQEMNRVGDLPKPSNETPAPVPPSVSLPANHTPDFPPERIGDWVVTSITYSKA